MQYGVLRARPDRAKREDAAATPHLQIRALDNTGQPWRVAVNVQSDDGSEVVFWVVDPLVSHPILGALPATPSGFTTTAANASESLDFAKAPLFDWTLGRALPPSGSANADDLQDLLTLYLDQCKAGGGELYVFGAKFENNEHKPIDAEFGNTDGLHGVHDIHMNQGNVGGHARDNATFHDGGLVLSFPDRVMGVFLAFQNQRKDTDASGNAAPGAKPLSQIISAQPHQHPPGRHVPDLSGARPYQPRGQRPRPGSGRAWQLRHRNAIRAGMAADRPQRRRDEARRRGRRRRFGHRGARRQRRAARQ
jgi:uncharacterized protein YukJ